VWHGVAFHDEVLSVCIVGTAPRALPVVSSYAFEVLGEPPMSQADAGYPVAESSGEEALYACIVWCPRWVGVWGVVRNLCFPGFLIMLFLLISLRLRLSYSVIIAS